MVDRRTVTPESRDGKCPLHCIKPSCKSHGDEDAFVLVLVLPEILGGIECALGDLKEDRGSESFGIFQVLLCGFQFQRFLEPLTSPVETDLDGCAANADS